jgi:hypothetical protein
MLAGPMPGVPRIGLEIVAVRQLPDFAVRLAARFTDPSLRGITPSLRRRNRHSTEKARRVLGWQLRLAAETVIDCARSLLEHGVPRSR